MPMQIYNVQRQDRGSSLKLTFLLKNQCNSNDVRGNVMSEIYFVNETVQVRFKYKQKVPHNNSLHANEAVESSITFMISTKLASIHPSMEKVLALNKDHIIKLKVTCKAFDYFGDLVCTDNWTDWLTMGEKTGTLVNTLLTQPIEVNMVVSKTKIVTFTSLYDDKDLTDFYLSTTQGKVAVHKACLAAHSDVFKSMLSKQWKETADGQINVPGASLKTLEHLKKYLYIGSLPDDDIVLRQLLILASCYMMEALKTECISKLTAQATTENLHNLVEYACENNIPELMIAILEQTPDEVIQKANEEKLLKKLICSIEDSEENKN